MITNHCQRLWCCRNVDAHMHQAQPAGSSGVLPRSTFFLFGILRERSFIVLTLVLTLTCVKTQTQEKARLCGLGAEWGGQPKGLTV